MNDDRYLQVWDRWATALKVEVRCMRMLTPDDAERADLICQRIDALAAEVKRLRKMTKL